MLHARVGMLTLGKEHAHASVEHGTPQGKPTLDRISAVTTNHAGPFVGPFRGLCFNMTIVAT